VCIQVHIKPASAHDHSAPGRCCRRCPHRKLISAAAGVLLLLPSALPKLWSQYRSVLGVVAAADDGDDDDDEAITKADMLTVFCT
jgi:hypothetical protein